MGFEFLITFLAAMAALVKKQDTLVAVLMASWAMSFTIGMTVQASLIPFTASLMDIAIALCALWLWQVFRSQRARIVATISLLKLLCHFAISAHFGTGDWYIYALLVNAFFVMQCVVAGGWFYGVVDFLNRISPWHHRNHAPSHEKNAP